MTLEAVQPGETRRMQFSIPVEEQPVSDG